MGDPREELKNDLDRIGDQRRTAEAAWKTAVEATDPAIERGLRGGIGPAEIARRLGVTDSYVRKVRKVRGIPGDPRYADKQPPRPTSVNASRDLDPPVTEHPVAPHPLGIPSREELPYRFRKLQPALAAQIVDQIRGLHPSWHEEVRALLADFAPEFHDGLEIKRAQDDRILDALDIKLP